VPLASLAVALLITSASAEAEAGALQTPPQTAAAVTGAAEPAQLTELITRAAQQALAAAPADTATAHPPRLEVALGTLDPRLKLAPCRQVQAFWPAGQRLLAQARVGLRCTEGPARWQVYMPVSIRVWAMAWLATGDLPAGTVLGAEHLRSGETDLLARRDAVVTNPALVYGRALARPLAGGQALRQDDLRLRQWVRPGDTVRVLAGSGSFQVTADAEALAPAFEGQPVRVRTESGRILQGVATAERQVTVPL